MVQSLGGKPPSACLLSPVLWRELLLGNFLVADTVMASADVRQELNCPVCLDIYTDPVTLRCGHNFCLVCIDRVLDTQEESGVYSCPECRKRFRNRPAPQKNITLCKIIERLLTTQLDHEETESFCTYCVDSPVPAVKSCLLCEVSLCDKHLRVHSKSPEHVLCDPTTSLGSRKCSAHKKMLEYYCTEDSACICVTCRLDGAHKGHNVEKLEEASEKKKEKLRNVLEKLITQRQQTEHRVQDLQERKDDDQERVAGFRETVTALFRDIRGQLQDLERSVLSEFSRQEQLVSVSVSDLVQQLEIKKDKLSRNIRDIEELCNMSDPIKVLRGQGDWCDTEVEERHQEPVQGGGDLDVGLISETFQTISNVIAGINTGLYVQGPADISLNVDSASNDIIISDDGKTASTSYIEQNRPVTAERFQAYQVMSSEEFSSERHYWEVDVRGSKSCGVGMCYLGADRTGGKSLIGHNNKSWGLWMCKNNIFVRHDRKDTQLPVTIPCDRVRIYLDYEAGQLSFYSLCDPIRLLHTFYTTFTEPLHAVLCVCDGSITITVTEL